ncbi:MAG: division/cell wall cluster transcriptional repressor MraZ [Acidobacteriota bacterium]
MGERGTMLRGNARATIDKKGRLKIPTKYRRIIEETHGREFFVTSLDGQAASLYPFPLWLRVEANIASHPSLSKPIMRLVRLLNYYGDESAMDSQGRILLQAHLREQAQLEGEVSVLGHNDHLEIWNLDRVKAHVQAESLSDEDYKTLSDFGL